ncbi:MAG: hypothetical protein AAF726_17895 [Planctomycetota bacterium]
MSIRHDERCPHCGRFVEVDGDGFYQRFPDAWDELCEVRQFCSVDCAGAAELEFEIAAVREEVES